VRQGSTIARSLDDAALFVAAEDLSQILRVPLPLTEASTATVTALPGPPAQVLALDGRLLVTVRDPGLLLAFDIGADGALTEALRVELPADAWGLAITPDEATALVTSAWTHQLSAVNLAARKKIWSVDLPREPRGVVVMPDASRAYVSHLVGSSISRVDLGESPRAAAVALPPAPVFFLPQHRSAASLGYALALSPDGRRLFAPRHAIGTASPGWWYGNGTIDVLLTAQDRPLALPRTGPGVTVVSAMNPFQPSINTENAGALAPGGPFLVDQPLVQPRAVAWRAATNTLLVAAEGSDRLIEYDPLAIEPAFAPIRQHALAAQINTITPVPASGGAPSGIAVSADGSLAYVHCRSTFEVVAVTLATVAQKGKSEYLRVRVATDPLAERAAIGRRAFYDATDTFVSGGLGCAGCHPEGRDDGHTWTHSEGRFFGAGQMIPVSAGPAGQSLGTARQTPMLAGRLGAAGPYGWHAQNKNLAERLIEGFHLHRFVDSPGRDEGRERYHAQAILDFVPSLRTPPRETHEATAAETRGREIFLSKEAACATCHVPETGYTNRAVYPMPEIKSARFEPDGDQTFRTPSLLFVGGTAPYYHDGSAASLEELIEKNGTRMGKTSHLSPSDRAALVAFLRTL
jgi:cytochrome c peroxidase